MTNYVTRYMHRGLFERHKKIWTLMLAMKIESSPAASRPPTSATCSRAAARSTPSQKPVPASGSPRRLAQLIALSRTVQMLRDLPDNLERLNDAWKQWYDHDAPETQLFPDYNERLDQFEKMLSCARSARTARCSHRRVHRELDRRATTSLVEPLDLRRSRRRRAR